MKMKRFQRYLKKCLIYSLFFISVTATAMDVPAQPSSEEKEIEDVDSDSDYDINSQTKKFDAERYLNKIGKTPFKTIDIYKLVREGNPESEYELTKNLLLANELQGRINFGLLDESYQKTKKSGEPAYSYFVFRCIKKISRLPLLECALQNGAYPWRECNEGKMLIKKALDLNNFKAASLIMTYGMKWTSSPGTTWGGGPHRDATLYRCLHLAVDRRELEKIEFLLQHGVNPNGIPKNALVESWCYRSDDEPALIENSRRWRSDKEVGSEQEIEANRIVIAKLLIKYGANPYISVLKDHYSAWKTKLNAIEFAREEGFNELAQMLESVPDPSRSKG